MNIQFIITGDDGNMYDLDALSNTDLTMICKNDLQEISQVKINTDLPLKQRIIQFLDEIKNPYCYLVGKHAVKTEFNDEGEPLQSILRKHFVEQRNRTLE